MLRGQSARAATAAVLLLLGTATAQAQISPFRSSRQSIGLSKADVTMLFDSAEALNQAAPLRVGDSRAWSNPASGNGGTVRLTRRFSSAGLACHTLRYDLSFKARAKGSTYTADWCKTAAGWRIKS